MKARGNMSRRKFARLLGVSQSTVQSWENGTNLPSLDNLEKLAQFQGMLVEDFVAYLYGRGPDRSTLETNDRDLLEQVGILPSLDVAQLLRVVADRLERVYGAQINQQYRTSISDEKVVKVEPSQEQGKLEITIQPAIKLRESEDE
nr:helix-turn-helix transcriptional regulator [Phormidium sp. FACHB-592]